MCCLSQQRNRGKQDSCVSHSLSSEEHAAIVFLVLESTRKGFLRSQGESAHILSNVQEEL